MCVKKKKIPELLKIISRFKLNVIYFLLNFIYFPLSMRLIGGGSTLLMRLHWRTHRIRVDNMLSCLSGEGAEEDRWSTAFGSAHSVSVHHIQAWNTLITRHPG